MKQLKKYLSMLALAALAFGAASCSDSDDYTPGPEASANCQEVYFPSTNPAEVLLTPDEVADASFDISVSRNQSAAAASIPVKVYEGTSEAFIIPATIEFAAGQAVTNLHIGLDPNAEQGQHSLFISFEGDEYVNPYKQFDGSVAYSLALTIETWTLLGMAEITDDFVTTFFGVENVSWEVEAWTRSTMEGYICLKNAYTSNYPYNDPGDYQEEDHYFYIDISDPKKVAIPAQYMGFDWGYGEFFFRSIETGTLEDGVITFPEKGLGVGMSDYNNGGTYYANNNGAFQIVLPQE